LPAERNKTKVDLLRPLSATAQKIIDEQPRIEGCPHVFTTTGRRPVGNFSEHKRAFDAASGVSGWVLHDLRRTARSLLSRAGVSADVAERYIGHVLTGVRGIYDRHEYQTEKARAAEALAALVHRIVEPSANVVQLRG
jgi:integrase